MKVKKYRVFIPARRWMCGVHYFARVSDAEQFMLLWNETEQKAGKPSVLFERNDNDWNERKS